LSTPHKTARDILAEAEDLPRSPEKVTLLEEAVRLADLEQDTDLAYEARRELVDAATYGGQAEKAMTAFAWCLQHHDTHPDQYWSYEILWRYKWILNAARGFPQIPLARVLELHADFERRVRAEGAGARVIPYFRMHLAIHLGNHDEARAQYTLWQFAGRDFLSDCAACEANSEIDYHVFQGHDDKALQKAQPILQGKLSCAHVPHSTHAKLLEPLVRLGRVDDAMGHHATGYPMIQGDVDFLPQHGQHLSFLALTGNLERARELYERHVDWALRSNELDDRFTFLTHALVWLRQLQQHGVSRERLALPSHHPLRQPGESDYDVTALLAWHEREAKALADRFDQRNGTTAFRDRVTRRLAMLDHATPHPIP